MKFKFGSLICLFICVSIIIRFNYFYERTKFEPSLQQSVSQISPSFYTLLTLGHKRLVSSIFWIRTMIEVDHEHYKEKDFKNWLYYRFDTIGKLDPNFLNNYIVGGIFLAIVKDDPVAAIDILERGHKKYPKNYAINYYLAFINSTDLKDNITALKYYENLLTIPGTLEKFPLLPSIIARLKSSKGTALNSFIIYYEALQRSNVEVIKLRILEKMKNFKIEFEKTCNDSCDISSLNEDQKNYIIKLIPRLNDSNFPLVVNCKLRQVTWSYITLCSRRHSAYCSR